MGIKSSITLSTLLSIATVLISLGVSFLENGQVSEGIICIVVGFGIICVGVYLFEKGIIDQLNSLALKVRKSGRKEG